jgi:acetoin:2,6-dichlorophenolindophenol oxidoreductase subunit alpha
MLDSNRSTNPEPAALDPASYLRQMALIRAFDSKLPDLYTRGLVRGSSHAAIGQEAVAVGACAAIRQSDFITSTHRGHGHAIAKGADVRLMMAELLGRESGYCHGKGGSMHIADFALNMLGANGIVGGGFGLAAGAALTAQLRGKSQIALCFFGEGAINQGSFHGVANLAAIWRLPLVLLCENNRFAMSGRVEEMTSVGDLAVRATAYGFPGTSVDGADVLAVNAATTEAVARARAGDGPSLIVANCYRFAGHFSGDTMKYRSKAEAQPWLERDPLRLLRESLVSNGTLTDLEAAEIIANAESVIDEAVAWAETQPLPTEDQAAEHLYA